MAGLVLRRCVSRTLLSAPGATGDRSRGATRKYWTTLRRTAAALTGGGAAFLLGIPALSWLPLEAYHRVQRSTAVYALEKEQVLEQADYLYSCGETEKLYQLLLQYKDSEDAEYLWRLARASRDLAMVPDTEARLKKQLFYDSLEYAKKALEKDDKCFAAHKWYAVCLGDVGEYEGVKVKIGDANIIREHMERAVELNPRDATSLYILGYWCFAFAELPWYQRKLAAVIFATPPQSTYEEALEFFLKAEEVDPNFYSKNLLMLGRTYMGMQDKELALFYLTKAKEYPAHTLEDKEVHKEAVDLLKKLG
ncbi:regulator of microtubule dynamics protein 1 [Pseudoliparis swirei]|uniref:regulator of microtubule dynamics protein 1 n=1 Tax=Pseudoliparis swirei TaxID=2059687 RepID=UPI0024BDDF9B|nr:regulator of microtubule dynamics protein 1 [Pseudoliparis swirei]